MEIYEYWFLLALVLVGLEMATGTFYLLVLAIAMAISGAAAMLGLGLAVQLALAAVSGVAGIVLLRRWKAGSTPTAASQSLDTGHQVKVLKWRDDGTARVFYRGAEWDAELETNNTGRDGIFYIKDIRGSVLVLTQQKTV